LRSPCSGSDARETIAPWPLTVFVIIVSGFVTYELSGVCKPVEQMFLWVPKYASTALPGAAAGWIQGVWTIVLLPLLFWLVLGAVTVLLGGAKSLGEAWRRLALPMAVIVATGHMAKALEKFTSWAAYLPYAWAEPTGVQTALKMNTKAMTQPAPWLTMPTLSIAAMALLALGIFLAIREARLGDPETGSRRIAPILLLGGFYLFLVCCWGGWTSNSASLQFP
jgi:hypothetical protein